MRFLILFALASLPLYAINASADEGKFPQPDNKLNADIKNFVAFAQLQTLQMKMRLWGFL